MEAYYHSDPRIEKWVDEITEKLFTVCLLTGVDSEVEFQKGCQIVTKVTHLLQGISMFPSEYLEDGLKQLLEQQLPDSRVISNFPTFQETMNKMLREGMLQAIGTPQKKSLNSLSSFEKSNYENTKEETKEESKEENPGCSAKVLNDEFANEKVVAALASLIPSSFDPLIQNKSYGIIRKTQVPEGAVRLKHVLSNIFPNISIAWNLNLMGQTFLAQVEDMLICLHNPEQPCPVKNLNKEGWKVYVCTSNDLMFPRRLERGIRQLQRFGKGRNG